MFRIKEILKEKSITMTSLAESIGTDQPHISNIISGRVNPSIELLQRIALALQVPISDLFEQPKQNIINCPHCGGKIKVEKE